MPADNCTGKCNENGHCQVKEESVSKHNHSSVEVTVHIQRVTTKACLCKAVITTSITPAAPVISEEPAKSTITQSTITQSTIITQETFKVFDRVQVREREEDAWKMGTVTVVSPLSVLVDGYAASARWKIVQKQVTTAEKRRLIAEAKKKIATLKADVGGKAQEIAKHEEDISRWTSELGESTVVPDSNGTVRPGGLLQGQGRSGKDKAFARRKEACGLGLLVTVLIGVMVQALLSGA